ncbi:EamA family transporter RarD [Nocardioides daejeonensis]|uniref:EamA family transporter RarD n=1 Tax=Nocardioides daejeonensis TaxID=1046556 RepID=UPI000D74ADE1|nr:EamA family transporter RarD [Nocardioides daejeonensis]
MGEERRGLALGVAAYAMWGLFPLYWPLLEPAGAVEILAHRVAWSMLTMAVLIVATRRTTHLRRLFAVRRTRNLLAVASTVIAVNWGTYIWGVNHGHVVETSLGYFINPLVTVLMGVLILRETMRPLQWLAIATAASAVVLLTIDFGRPPWVALTLAFSFGTYGLAKKQANAGSVESLTFETMLLTPVAVGYIAYLTIIGEGHFATEGAGHALLLTGTGVITAVPLICFGAAAIRLPMVTLGLLQYLAPIIQFALGVWVLHEEMPAGRWIGFTLVWLALVIFTFEAAGHRRRQLRLAAESSAI